MALDGSWSFDPVNNVETKVGGTSGDGKAFDDAHTADVGGTRALLAATASPFTASLTTSVKPCESLALKLSAVITGFSVAGTIVLTGKDAWGNAQNETLVISADGTVVSTLYYASIDANGVVAVGTFSAAVSQPRWGVVWKQSSTQYAFDCKLQVGDGSTATYFTDINKQILVSVSGGYIYTKVGSTFTLGSIDANGNTYNGCTLTFTNPNIQAWSSDGSTGDIYLYASMVKGYMFWRMYRGSSQIVKIIDCTIDGWIGGRFQGASSVIKRLRIHDGTLYGLTLVSPNPVVSEVRVDRSDYAVFINADVSSIVSMNLVTARNNVKSIYVYPASVAASLALIDCDFDAWTLNFASAGTVFRQYEFDLTTEPSATVTLKDASGNTALYILVGSTWTPVASVTADGSGVIATHNFRLQYYDQAHGNVPVCAGPFTLKIVKAGKVTYEKVLDIPVDPVTGYYNPSSAFKLQVKLADAHPVLLGVDGRPVLNLRPSDAGNVVVLPL